MKNIIFAAIALIVALFVHKANAATVTLDESETCTISLSGPIDGKTPGVLEAALQKLKGPCQKEREKWTRLAGPLAISLKTPMKRYRLMIGDSPGGDLRAAMEVGRIVRREMMDTTVRLDASCASACVFAYLGGVSREAIGRLGLHRPYAAQAAESLLEARERFKQANNLVKAYLEEMAIPVRLLDMMNATNPDQVRWIGHGEADGGLLSELMLEGEDPAFADLRDTDLAAMYGLSKPEYYARRTHADKACKGARDYMACYVALMRAK